MEGALTAEETIEELKKQNLELARHVQFYKQELDTGKKERILLQREINALILEKNRYQLYIKKINNIEKLVNGEASQSLAHIVQASEYIRKVVELVSGQYTMQKLDESSSVAESPLCNPRSPVMSTNVHQVRPMIRGVTLKNPIIRVSRTLQPTVTPGRSTDEPNVHNTSVPISPSRSRPSPLRRLELLDLCVSLRRVDNTSERIPSTANNSTNNESTNSSNLGTSQSQDPAESISVLQENGEEIFQESLQDEDTFDNDEIFITEAEDPENFGDSDTLNYRPRLDCILEESENEPKASSSFTHQSLRTNPVVVLKRDFASGSGRNDAFEPEVDPMEGPSWQLDGARINVKSDPFAFVSVRNKNKKFVKPPPDVPGPDDQIPDSTTNNKDLNFESMDSIKFSPPLLQSTPNFKSSPNSNESTQMFTSDDNTSLPSNVKISKRKTNDLSNVKNSGNIQVIAAKMDDSVRNEGETSTSERIQKNVKSKKSSATNNNAKTVKKRNCPSSSRNSKMSAGAANSESNDTSSMRISTNNETNPEDSVDEFQIRPRRTQQKDYKEKPLNKKLRRL